MLPLDEFRSREALPQSMASFGVQRYSTYHHDTTTASEPETSPKVLHAIGSEKYTILAGEKRCPLVQRIENENPVLIIRSHASGLLPLARDITQQTERRDSWEKNYRRDAAFL